MANSKITITFNSDANVGDWLSFERIDINGTGTPIVIKETFVVTRANNYEIPMPTQFYLPAGLATANYYKPFFELDYNGFNLYVVSSVSNVVTIESANEFWKYQNFTTNNLDFTAVINNISPPIELVSETISTALDPCNYIVSTIQTTELATSVYINAELITNSNTLNPYITDIPRDVPILFRFESLSGSYVEYKFPIIQILSSNNINVNIQNFLTGATLTIVVDNSVGLDLQYSLDNVTWQTSNVFTGQSSGTSVLYVKDQYGCLKSKSYTVNDLGTRTPFAYISRANSISFSKVEAWDGYTIFKNNENTLDNQGLQDILYIQPILFQTKDITKIQTKSNYEVVTAKIIDSNNVETSLTVNKKSSNLNRFSSMDAVYYKYREGKLGIYFNSGNIYDEAGTDIGDYTLNGNLPEFAILGQQISIENIGVFSIVDILYDESKNKKVIIVDYIFNGTDTQTKVLSIYDILNYEIYEFIIDWSLFSNGRYNVEINHIDTINGTVKYYSEKILLDDIHYKTLAIRSFNNNNHDVFYKYGIEHFIRVPYMSVVAKQDDESEINITDDSAVLVKSNIYEYYEYKFYDVPESIMHKLVISLSCENVFINGIGYIKKGNIAHDNIQNTNTYLVTANMIKTGISYNNYIAGKSGTNETYINYDIPSIITTGTNFIKS